MSECACIYDGDGEMPEFWAEKVVKARKPHTCAECLEPIRVGESYERVVGKWDSELATQRTCLTCVEIRNHLFCDGWTYGLIWERIEEAWAEKSTNPLACINKLETVAAREKLSARYRAWLDVPNG